MTTPAPKNGCFNRAPYKATNDLRDLAGNVVTSIPHTMTTDCQYTKSELGQADARCHGCSWRHEPKPVCKHPRTLSIDPALGGSFKCLVCSKIFSRGQQ